MFQKYFKSKNKLAILFLVLILSISMLAGCGESKNSSSNTSSENSGKVEESTTRVITDMSGREVTIPSKINKAYATSPVPQIVLYTINPEKVVGLNFKLTELEKKYTVEGYSELPVLGGWFGKDNKGNIEEILKANPDVIISMGDITEQSKSFAEELQKQIKIPVVIADGQLEKLSEGYKFLGEILNEEKRCNELAEYCEKTVKEAKEIAKTISEEEKTTVYYAQGQEGLQTDPSGSTHAELLDLVGGKNIADVEMKSGYGRTDVSIEQVLNWNPDKIIICKDKDFGSNAYEVITNDSKWSNLKAVKTNQVYEIPDAPYNYFDRPPSVNRIIGIKWLGNLLYPDKFDYNIEEEIKDFYKKFYHYEIKDGDLDEILVNAKSK